MAGIITLSSYFHQDAESNETKVNLQSFSFKALTFVEDWLAAYKVKKPQIPQVFIPLKPPIGSEQEVEKQREISETGTSQTVEDVDSLLDILIEEELKKVPNVVPEISQAEIEETFLTIFTDASGGRDSKYCSYGVFAGIKSPLTCSVLLKETSSTHLAEMQAVIQTLKKIKKLQLDTKPILMFTDLGVIVTAITEYKETGHFSMPRTIPAYQLGAVAFYNLLEKIEWKGATTEAKHLKIICDLAHSCRNGIYLIHVPAHRGITQNELADTLAKVALQKGKSLPLMAEKCWKLNRNQLKSYGRKRNDSIRVRFVHCEYQKVDWKKNDKKILDAQCETIWDSSNDELHEFMRERFLSKEKMIRNVDFRIFGEAIFSKLRFKKKIDLPFI